MKSNMYEGHQTLDCRIVPSSRKRVDLKSRLKAQLWIIFPFLGWNDYDFMTFPQP